MSTIPAVMKVLNKPKVLYSAGCRRVAFGAKRQLRKTKYGSYTVNYMTAFVPCTPFPYEIHLHAELHLSIRDTSMARVLDGSCVLE